MAKGDTTISGAYAVSDTSGIEGFVEHTMAGLSNIGSGAAIFTYPAANGLQVYVGVTQSG